MFPNIFLGSLLHNAKRIYPLGRGFTTQLNEHQAAVQNLAKNYANEHLKPNASKLDLQGRFPFDQVSKWYNFIVDMFSSAK